MYRFENPFTGETRRYLGGELSEKGFGTSLDKRSGAIWFCTVENQRELTDRSRLKTCGGY